MVALNSDFAASKPDANTKNRVGRFFSLAAETVGADSRSSRNRTGEKRGCRYDTTSVNTEFEYGAFGELIRSIGEKKDAFNFRFSTKYEDAETGLLYYGYRYYNAETGRWLSRDPIGEQGGLNLYCMVGNSPVNDFDPFGLSGFDGPFDGKHPNVKACSASECCAENLRRLFQWITAAQRRRDIDFTDYWRLTGTKQSWDNHRQQYLDTRANAAKCIGIILEQLISGQCVPRPPELSSFPAIQEQFGKLDDPGEFEPIELNQLNWFQQWAISVPEESIPTMGEAFLYGSGGALVVIGTGGIVLGVSGSSAAVGSGTLILAPAL